MNLHQELEELLKKPRISSNGGWAVIPEERIVEVAQFIDKLWMEVHEADPDGDSTIQTIIIDRRTSRAPGASVAVPYRCKTVDEKLQYIKAISQFTYIAQQLSDELMREISLETQNNRF